jgi:hypothetical protein
MPFDTSRNIVHPDTNALDVEAFTQAGAQVDGEIAIVRGYQRAGWDVVVPTSPAFVASVDERVHAEFLAAAIRMALAFSRED